MGFLKQLIYSIFSYLSSLFIQQSTSSEDGSNLLAAFKLNGYYDLAMEEIYKAASNEVVCNNAGAVKHYRNAANVLTEAMSMPLPSCNYFSKQAKVISLCEKISEKQGQVLNRLLELIGRTGAESIKKGRTGAVIRSASSPKRVASQNFSGPSGHNSTITSDIKKIMARKPVQDNGDDRKLVEMIESEILGRIPFDKWEDIAGLEMAKNTLKEMVILPMARKDLYFGLRTPSKGLLLFGPPGTGKTMLAKAVASESKATFFNITPSSLTSKWVGEGEKLVRTLFMVANSRKPAVIFIDEIDSILSARTSRENEASRRLKSEFLVQFDGVASKSDDLVVIGATNRPQELDDAVLRRLVKRIYIPLPDAKVRRILLKHKLKGKEFSLPSGDLWRLAKETEGYSGSDLDALCKDAAMMPLRELTSNGKISTVKPNQVRGLKYEDFKSAMNRTKPSINISKLEELEKWNKNFGCNRD